MRHDYTKWLTHFVRDRVPEQDFPGDSEEESGRYHGDEIEPDADAFAVLKTIIRLGGITPGYSFRSGRTTIYGGQPAVCATEMPLYSLAQYVRSRSDSGKVSAYGIAFLKTEFHAAGGRPVIYGLSTDNPRFIENTATRRIFDAGVLPVAEQYRYVAYNPASASNWVDWSHEREWRWIVQNKENDEVWAQNFEGMIGPTPALPVFKGRLDGRPFTRVCVIVWAHEEAQVIRELLTGIYLAGCNNYDTPFDRNLIEASRIIVLQDVVALVETGKHLGAQTIEGLEEADLLLPIAIAEPPKDAPIIVARALEKAGAAAKAAADAYSAANNPHGGYCGHAHATTYDVTNPLVQFLLKEEKASGPFDGAVWIDFPQTYPPSPSLDYNEAACEAAAEVLSAELGIKVYCTSLAD